tara:strand:- start:1956 stop:2261 length:306 start_codon:yes stop_codon:yes gene_type:complete
MVKVLQDLTVKVSEYTNNAGETKGRYVNVGKLMEGDNGMFIILNRTFNPAGVPNPENRDSVIISCFEPKDWDAEKKQQPTQQQKKPDAGSALDDLGDEIPF